MKTYKTFLSQTIRVIIIISIMFFMQACTAWPSFVVLLSGLAGGKSGGGPMLIPPGGSSPAAAKPETPTATTASTSTQTDTTTATSSATSSATTTTTATATSSATSKSTTIAKINSIDTTTVSGAYSNGTIIPLTVTFSEEVVVTGTPTLKLNNGAIATYDSSVSSRLFVDPLFAVQSGAGIKNLVFNYSIAATDTNISVLDYADTNSIVLNGGSIKTLSSDNDADLTLPAPGTAGSISANKTIAVDTIAPTVTYVSSSVANATYGIGAVVPVEVLFSESVLVTGTPTITLNSGVTVNYSSGASSNTLVFNYTIASGETAFPLNYSATNSLSGTIKDSAGNVAVVTLPGLANANALGVKKSININGNLPVIGFTASSSNGSEATTTVNIPVTISVTSNATVNYTLSGTASGAGVDYTLANGTLTFTNGGATSQNLTITVNNDTLNEIDETVIITLSGPTNSALGANQIYTYTINDDDPQPTVAFALTSSNGSEAVASPNIAVTLSSASGKIITVDYAISGSSSATGGGVDYTLAAGTLTFAAGVTTQNITPTIVNDTLNETNETLVLTISNPGNSTLGANTSHTYTINDNDTAPTVAFNATTSNGAESVTSVSLPVSLSSASGQTVTVNYAVTGGTASGSGTDYTLASGTLTFNAGTTTQNIAVTVVDDAATELNETIIVTLSAPSNSTLGANTAHTYTINDNDAPTVAFSATSSNGSESTTAVTIPVTLSAAYGSSVTVDYAVTGGSATGSGTDYTLAAGTLTFAAGVTSQNISVTIVNDTSTETNETIQITLSNPTASTLGTNTVHTYTIDDNDPPTVAFNATTSNGSESTTSVNIPVSLSAAYGQSVTVNYAVTGGTASGSGTDYTLASGTLTFNSGTTTQNIAVTVNNDSLSETNETIIVGISGPSNATLGANTSHTYTINDDDTAPTVAFNATSSNGAESVTAVTIPVSLSAVSGQTVTVAYSVTGGTATGGGTDYTLTAGTLTFNPGVTSQNISVTVVNDALTELNETIVVDLSSPSNSTLGTNTSHTYTINDNDPPTVAFNATTSNGSEATTAVTIPVTLSAAYGASVTVDYAVTGGSATGGGTDYTLASGTLTFAAGVTTQNVSMTVVNDTATEANETVQITLSNPTGGSSLGTNTIHTYTINDNDGPSIAFDATTSNGSEATTAVTIPVSLSAAYGSSVTVDYAVTGGSATGSGTDYTLAAGTLTFAAGVTTQNVSVTVVNDALTELNETIQITLSNPTGGSLGANTIHTYTINDNDAPTVAFNATTSNGAESVTSVNIPVSLSAAYGSTVTVNYAVTGGSATGSGTDYTLASGTLTFNSGTTSQNIAVTINNDSLNEANETIVVDISGPSNATLGTNTSHTYTINDDDTAPTVAFNVTTSNASESTTSVSIPVSLSVASGQSVTVNYAVNAGSTATGGGTDYTLANGTLTFAAGTTTQNISVTIVNDVTTETNETIIIDLSAPANATLGTNTSHTYTIIDNDAPAVAFSATTSNGSEATTAVTIPVTLAAAYGTSVTVDYAVTGGSATGGGTDYTLTSGTLTFAAGVTSQNISMTVVNDTATETNETVQITLSNPTGGSSLGANTIHTYTINDNDPPAIAFSATTSNGSEATTAVTIPVTLSAAYGSSVTVDYAVTGGTATGGGTDYTLAAGTLTFAAGVTSQNISVTVVNDTATETNETIQITLSNPTGGSSLGANTIHTYTINDNDGPSVAFSATTSNGSEATTAVTIPVTLATAYGSSITVDYAVTGGTATGGGTDYTLASGTLTFAAGVTSQNISVTVVNDTATETDETIQITLSNPTGGSSLGANTIHTYTINDNDPPAIAFDATTSNGSEATTAVTIPVSLSAAYGSSVTVDYAVTGGSATGSGTDYTLAAGTLTFAAGVTTQNVSVTVVNDALTELNETIQITISNPTGGSSLGANTIHTYTINDNDAPTVAFNATTSNGAESVTSVNIPVSLSAAYGSTVTVNYAVTGGSATGSGTDYTLASGTLTFNSGTTSQNIAVTINNDSLNEANETIVVDISGPSNATLGTNTSHTYTINDDDTAPTVAFNVASSNASESTTSVSIPVSLSAVSGQSVTVNYAVNAGSTATGGGTDYTLANGTLTFAAGVTTQNISITVVNDALTELNETIIIDLSGPANATLGTNTSHTYTINDNDPPTVAFNATTSNGSEATTAVTIPVTLSAAYGTSVTVDYAVTGGTATGGGTDYTFTA